MSDLQKIDFDAIYDSLSPEDQRKAGLIGLRSVARLCLALTLKIKDFLNDLPGNAGDR
jgi:hypothetical protein